MKAASIQCEHLDFETGKFEDGRRVVGVFSHYANGKIYKRKRNLVGFVYRYGKDFVFQPSGEFSLTYSTMCVLFGFMMRLRAGNIKFKEEGLELL